MAVLLMPCQINIKAMLPHYPIVNSHDLCSSILLPACLPNAYKGKDMLGRGENGTNPTSAHVI